MIALFGVAWACDPAASVEVLRTAGSKDAYLCVAKDDAGAQELGAALDAGGEGGERLTRALALWLLTRTDKEMDVTLVRRLSPADRRLLSDGIRARRGRRTPVTEHAAVFSQFEWYTPQDGYTDGRLRDVDRRNIRTVDSPPAPEPAPVEAPAPEPEPTERTWSQLCGCDAAGVPVLAWLAAVVFAGWRRR